MKCGVSFRCGLLSVAGLIGSTAFAQAATATATATAPATATATVYRCPGKPVLC